MAEDNLFKEHVIRIIPHYPQPWISFHLSDTMRLIDITKIYTTSNKWNLTTRPAWDMKVISDRLAHV